jgi:hypothetical protein
VVIILLIAGDQIPVIPLLEIIGKGANVAPEQIGATVVNIGRIFGLTIMVRLTGTEHCPVVGVKE